MHHTPLIATIVAGLSVAFILGALAQRLKLSPLVGYVLAGVLIGPFTPGYVADQELANELAEIGVILLMFGVGLHFSLKDLLAVRKIAIPGAVAQMAAATLLGMGLAHLLGWSLMGGFVFGLALSVASTVVLLRALQQKRAVQTERGRIAVGWLIVEDLAMVLALVLLPALAGAMQGAGEEASLMTSIGTSLGVTLLKVGGFVAFMLIVGRRVIPWVLHYVAHTGSRELFRLAVLAIALGVAFGAAMLFDVSFALGAFFAGMILAESELSHRAAEETLPLRDAFAVLFFVSVGMLFNPSVVVDDPWPLLATIGIIIVGKSMAALALMALYKRGPETSFTVAASLAQIGEFSFILAGLGVSLKLLPPEGRDLILGGAIISIMLNPLVFALADRLIAAAQARKAPPAPANDPAATQLQAHAILVGYGRVGEVVAKGFEEAGTPFVVIESDEVAAERARAAGFEVIEGNCADGKVLSLANIAGARRILVAIPDAFEAGQIVEQAKRANPAIEIVARAHSDEEVQHLATHGADVTIMGEREIARGMLELAGAVEKPAAAPPPAAAPAMAQPANRLILDDAERAILAAFHEQGAGPGEPVDDAVLFAHGATLGFDRRRLEAALASLDAQNCVIVLGGERSTLTAVGFLAAEGQPPTY